MSLTVLIAPSGFKESLSVKDVAEALARGVRRAAPQCGDPDRTVVIEMAAAAGLSLVPCDPTMTTSRGVARIFGPQKGATPDQVERLDRGMIRYAEAIYVATGQNVGPMPGAGASGGLGAELHPRLQITLDYLDFDHLLGRADLVITAEGALDGQSPFGKVLCEVARRAAALGIPTVALAGTIGKGARQSYEHGIGACTSIMRPPCSLQKAIGGGAKLLRKAAENTMRMLLVGQRLADRHRA